MGKIVETIRRTVTLPEQKKAALQNGVLLPHRDDNMLACKVGYTTSSAVAENSIIGYLRAIARNIRLS
jgi:hypothetical protein